MLNKKAGGKMSGASLPLSPDDLIRNIFLAAEYQNLIQGKMIWKTIQVHFYFPLYGQGPAHLFFLLPLASSSSGIYHCSALPALLYSRSFWRKLLYWQNNQPQ